MAEDNVIVLPVDTILDLPPERLLRAAIKADLECVVIVGIGTDGEPYFASSVAYLPDTLWHLERAKHKVMRMADECEDCDPNGAA